MRMSLLRAGVQGVAPALWAALLALTLAVPATAATRALVGATLIDGTGAAPVEDAVVVVGDGRIQCAGERDECAVPDEAERVSLDERWIVPGIVDAHVHFSQTGWADGRPDSLDLRADFPYIEVQRALERRPQRWFRSYLCAGVTAVFDVGGYPWTWRLPQRTDGNPQAPRVAAAGPLLSTVDHWVNVPGERQFLYLADEQTARRAVRYVAVNDSDAVKLWFIPSGDRDASTLDALVDTVGETAARHDIPMIVHATRLRDAKVALRAGARLLVHSVWDRKVDEAFIELAKARKAMLTPTLTVGRGYYRMYRAALRGEPPTIDDPNRCVDPEMRAKVASSAERGETVRAAGIDAARLERREQRIERRERIAAENLARLHEAGIGIGMGTDAGNPLTLHGPAVYPEMEAMQEAGLSAMEVLVASTRGSARAMGALDERGTLEAGKVADLLVLGADPTQDIANMRRLERVMRHGEMHAVDALSYDD